MFIHNNNLIGLILIVFMNIDGLVQGSQVLVRGNSQGFTGYGSIRYISPVRGVVKSVDRKRCMVSVEVLTEWDLKPIIINYDFESLDRIVDDD